MAAEQLLPRELWQLKVGPVRLLDLTDHTNLTVLNLGARDLVRDDHRLTRQIGEAAHQQRFQAILTPSATGVDNVLAVFPENLATSALEIEFIEEWATVTDLPC